MRKILIICLIFLPVNVLFIANAQGQNSVYVETRQIDTIKPLTIPENGIVVDVNEPQAGKSDSIIISKNTEFSPNPNKAILYSAIFPGLGQIYNRKFWKLPIVYGGFFGVAYGISWNGRYYTDYSNAFKDLATWSEPHRWVNLSRYTIYELERNEALRNQEIARLKRAKDTFRRNRDLAIIVGVGLYALCIIDAYVDAQLYHFDISPDLTMQMAPVYWPTTAYSQSAIGFQCNITF